MLVAVLAEPLCFPRTGEFRSFIGRNLLVGALLPASIYGVAKAALGASVLF